MISGQRNVSRYQPEATRASLAPADLNLILFDRAELTVPLPTTDRRAIHLVKVLRRREGDSFDAGIINGPRGKGKILRIGNEGLSVEFTAATEQPPNDAMTLIVGLPRPQTARDVLREVTSLGVESLHFVSTDKGELNYGQSSLWKNREWYRHLLLGAEQAFSTRLPEVTFSHALFDVVSDLPIDGMSRIALDNYESQQSLSRVSNLKPAVTLAIGPERGWSAAERDGLRERGFELAHLGQRVLRTETACIAAISLLKAKKGWI